MKMSDKEKDFTVSCSDEELVKTHTESSDGWEPPPEVIVDLFEKIAREKTLPIKWTWKLGKREPTPSLAESDSDETETDEKVEISGFEFDDDMTTPKLTPRRPLGTGKLKGSAKKKTTTFENVMASVRRQKKLEAKEKRKRERK